MEGTPQLLTDVKFTQLRKGGYDPEEVDNYLERINEAVAKLAENLREANERAESAQSQLADARRAQADAEAELDRIRGGEMGTTSSGASADEELAKVLVLAQRAADQALAEANETAARTVSDARAKAVNLLADAEQERERLLAKARKKADAVAEERVRTLNEQVAALSAAKVDLETDVSALGAHLELERDRLRDCIEAVRNALDDPAGLRLAPTPELLDTPIPLVDLPSTVDRPSPFAPLEDEPTEAFVPADAGLLGVGPTTPARDDATVAFDGIDEGHAGEDDRLSTSFLDEEAAEATSRPDHVDDVEPAVDVLVEEPIDGGAVAPDEDDEADDALFHAGEADQADDALFRADETGETAPEVDTGPTSQLFSEEHPLGPPDEQADAAMRAFFERDLDDPGVTARSRFGRRR
ncbi:MAG TPA: DivIVA domain-containing protein [Acidimicrobiales bacterium]|nr:DivIVA domain-containing protein [Acidimicrobiales bacterium]